MESATAPAQPNRRQYISYDRKISLEGTIRCPKCRALCASNAYAVHYLFCEEERSESRRPVQFKIPEGNHTVECRYCGARWEPRTEHPVKCIRCRKTDWEKENTNIHKQ